MNDTRPDRPGARVVWARVEDGFHVASRDGEFLGYIDRDPDGMFAAHDLYSRPLGMFPALVAAMVAVTDVSPAPVPRPRWSPGG